MIKVTEDCCPNTLAVELQQQVSDKLVVGNAQLKLSIVRKCHLIDGIDNDDSWDSNFVNLDVLVTIQPTHKAWKVFEQAVLELFERLHIVKIGDDLHNYHVQLFDFNDFVVYTPNPKKMDQAINEYDALHGQQMLRDIDFACLTNDSTDWLLTRDC